MKTPFVWLLLLILCTSFTNGIANQFYASPTGTNTASGGKDNPWSLQTALRQPAVLLPGDTIWLRGGEYIGNFQSTLQGKQDYYIYVLQYPNERATIVDNRRFAAGATLQINGAWTIYQGFEITNNNPNRTSDNKDSFRPMGIQMQAHHSKIINLIIHDVGHGIGFWADAIQSEIYGCLIYNCGTANKPGEYITHGHGIYTQNNQGIKQIRNNIVFNQFGFGLHAYPNPDNVDGYYIEGNIFFNNGILTHDSIRFNNILFNTYSPYSLSNITINKNYTFDSRELFTYTSLYQADVYLGAINNACSHLYVTNNTFYGKGKAGVAILNWDSVIFTHNNLFYRTGILGLSLLSESQKNNYSWNRNTYRTDAKDNQFSYQGNANISFNQWKNLTGFDSNSNFLPTTTGGSIVITKNQYQIGRATIHIYHPYNYDSIPVPITEAGLSKGEQYIIRTAHNYYGAPIQIGSCISDTIWIRKTSTSPAAPVGMLPLQSTEKDFAVYILQLAETQTTTNVVSELISQASIYLYPNPIQANNRFFIRNPSGTSIESVEIVNSCGQTQYTSPSSTSGTSEFGYPTNMLVSGIYFCRIRMGTRVFFKPFIIY